MIIPDYQVLLFTSVIVAVTVVIMILWSSVYRFRLDLIVVDPNRAIYDYYNCNSGKKVFLGILAGWLCLVFLYGCYLAFRIRVVPIKVFNESRIIGYSMYVVVTLCFIIFVLQLSGVQSNRLLYGCRSFAILLGGAVPITILFTAKFTLGEGDSLSGSSVVTSNVSISSEVNESSTSSVLQTITDQEKKIEELEKEVKMLKQELLQYRRTAGDESDTESSTGEQTLSLQQLESNHNVDNDTNHVDDQSDSSTTV